MGQTASCLTRTGVTCVNKIYDPHHGKGPADGEGSKVKGDVADMIHNGHSIQDARSVVLHLAMRWKDFVKDENLIGVNCPTEYIIGYLDDDDISKEPTQFKPFAGSREMKFRVGVNQDTQRIEDNPLLLRSTFCACVSCFLPKFDYRECEFSQILTGSVQKHNCKIVSSHPVAVTRTQSLLDFIETIKAGEYRAVRVQDDQKTANEIWWVAEILSEGYQLEETTIIAGETFEGGFWVVNIRWLVFFEKKVHSNGTETMRIYTKQPDKGLLSINTIMRIDPVIVLDVITTGRRRNDKKFSVSKEETHRIDQSE